tara:strand:+ start:200 stop:1345 length:1146 start_codon:yes stop_codon:yes gene_type:complete
MQKKRIAIIGAGNAGCITALHFNYYSKDKYEIVLYHNPKEFAIERVGQGTNVSVTQLITHTIESNWYDRNYIDATFKKGILYEGWGKKQDKIFHSFPMNTMSMHYVPQKLSDTILKSGLFEVVEKTIDDPEKDIDADFIFDCRGRHNRNKDDYEPLINPLNSCLLYKKDGKDVGLDLTRTVATPNGWTFVIPNFNSVSYGYLYNDTITSTQAARHDFIERFNLPETDYSTLTANISNISFENYVAKNIFVGERTILNGNRYSFLEPLEATSTRLYQSVCRFVWDYMQGNRTKIDSNYNIKRVVKQLETFILWHYQFGSKYDTPFWKYAKSLPFKPDSYFKELLEKSKLESYFELESKPRYDEDYYADQWTYSSFRYWNDGV